jgi:hypothetical protein
MSGAGLKPPLPASVFSPLGSTLTFEVSLPVSTVALPLDLPREFQAN